MRAIIGYIYLHTPCIPDWNHKFFSIFKKQRSILFLYIKIFYFLLVDMFHFYAIEKITFQNRNCLLRRNVWLLLANVILTNIVWNVFYNQIVR